MRVSQMRTLPRNTGQRARVCALAPLPARAARALGMTKMPDVVVSTPSIARSVFMPAVTQPNIAYCMSRCGARPRSRLKEEPPELGSSCRAMDSTPGRCFTWGSTSRGTLAFAMAARAALIRCRLPLATSAVCATKPLSTRKMWFVM